MFQKLLCLACLIVLQPSAVSLAQQAPDDAMPGMLVHSGIRHQHIYCTGTSSGSTPTVVLEAGLGSTMLDWHGVQNELSDSLRVCSYDRGGYGWSARAETVRLIHILAGELDALLLMAGEKPPYLIAGHSFGGLVAMYYAHRYPEKTAGLALVDSTHPEQFRVFDRAGIPTPQAPSGGTFFIRNFDNVPDALPVSIRPLARQLAAQRKTVEVLYSELRHLRRNADSVAKLFPSANQVPATVLSRSGATAANAKPARKLREQVWQDLQRDLAARLNTELQIAETPNHYVHLAEPALIGMAIKNLVERTH